MKTKLTKVIAMMFVVLMVVTALPVYAGSADSMNCDEAKASKILPESSTKSFASCGHSSYSEPPMGTVLGTWSPRSNYVRWLQDCLNLLGYNCGSVDGWYGNNTKKAVQAYQRANHLGVDGVFGDETHTMIRLDFDLLGNPFKVTARNGLNVRTSANTNSSIIGALNYGAYVYIITVEYHSNGDKWGMIDYNGTLGYINLFNSRSSSWYVVAS